MGILNHDDTIGSDDLGKGGCRNILVTEIVIVCKNIAGAFGYFRSIRYIYKGFSNDFHIAETQPFHIYYLLLCVLFISTTLAHYLIYGSTANTLLSYQVNIYIHSNTVRSNVYCCR